MRQHLQILKLPSAVILFLFSSAVSAQWIKKANALKVRSEIGSVVYNNKVYTFFGFRNYSLNIESSVEVYDPAANTWKLLASLPSNKTMTHEGIALIDDNIWLIGGRVGTNPGPLTNAVWIYNITDNSWSAGPAIKDPATGNPLPWAAGGAVFLGRTLHLFGGFVENACNDQNKYHLTLDVDNWRSNPTQSNPWKNELAPLPLKRNHFATVILAGKIYAIGGQAGHDCGDVDGRYVHAYDPTTDTWKQLTSLPSPRSHIEGSTFAIDGKIYVAAGQGANSEDTKLVTIFDPAANNEAGSWTNDGNLSLPASYEGVSAKVVNNTFIVSHGGKGGSRYPQNSVYSRTLVRHPLYQFGFSAECLKLDNSSSNSLKGHTWLYTIDGTKAYTTSSNAGWLVVSKNASGTAGQNAVDIEVTANADGLGAGTYNAIITATGSGSGNSYNSAKLCVTLTVQQISGVKKYNLTTTTSGNGSITKSPDAASYGNGSSVVLTATPASGQQFSSWSGAVTGTANPVTIVMNSDKSVTANFQPVSTSDLITHLTSTGTKSYTVAQLEQNVKYYTDRTYYVTDVPPFLNLAPFIKTPNDDKSNSSSLLMEFTLTQDAIVYVAYDPRASALPAWLKDWQKISSTLGITDATLTYFNLYSKAFPAGKVTLGGNLASPAAGSRNNYIVIAVAQASQLAGENANKFAGVISDMSNPLSPFTFTNSMLKIYPNPFYGKRLTIQINDLPKHQEMYIAIADFSGKVYQTTKQVADGNGTLKKQLNFRKSFPPGMYILHISSAAFSRFAKIIVN